MVVEYFDQVFILFFYIASKFIFPHVIVLLFGEWGKFSEIFLSSDYSEEFYDLNLIPLFNVLLQNKHPPFQTPKLNHEGDYRVSVRPLKEKAPHKEGEQAHVLGSHSWVSSEPTSEMATDPKHPWD